MDFFKALISPLERIIKSIDNGEFFKRPMVWFYIFSGIISALGCLYVIYWVYESFDYVFRYSEGWSKFVAVIMLVMVVIGLVVMGIYSFYFWWKRALELPTIVEPNQKITAIPVVGNIIQTAMTILGIQLIAMGCYLCTLLLLYSILTWSFYEASQFFVAVFTWIASLLGCSVVGYIIILFGHFAGEQCRVWAIVGNNMEGMRKSLKTIAREE